MITLNLRNIEEILFHNYELRKLMPEFRHYFDQWSLAQQHTFLKQTGKQAVLDLLNNLNENHAEIISSYFGMKVTIDKFNNRTVREYNFSVAELPEKIKDVQDHGHLFLYRNGDQVYLCTWR